MPANETKAMIDPFVKETLEEFDVEISDVRKEWEKNTLSFSFKKKGVHIEGKITARDYSVLAEIKMPKMFCTVRNKIVNKLNKQARKLLNQNSEIKNTTRRQ